MATTTVTTSPRFSLRLPDAVSALAERDFRIIWIGQAVSLSGTWMQMIAQGLVVLSLWNSAFALGAVNFANAVPSLVVMLFGGVLADRADKRVILLVTQVGMMLLALLMAVLVVTGEIQIWMIICITAALGIAIGYDMPAYGAFLPSLVRPEKIGQVVALNSATFHGSRMVGPALAGVVIAGLGLSGAFFLNSASFLAVIASLLFVRYRPAPRAADAQQSSALEGLREGLRHVRGRPHLRALMLLSFLNVFFVFPPMAILMPFYATEVLDGGSGTLAAFMAASGVGSVAGALALIWWSRRARETQLWFGVLAAPAGLIALSLVREPALALCFIALVSLAFSSQFGMIQTITQESTPDEYRGRVTSLFSLIFSGAMPIAGLAAAGLTVALGMPALMAGVALLYLVTGALVLRYAAGGIGNVVSAAHGEYEAIAAGG